MGIQEFNLLVDKFRKGDCSIKELRRLETQLHNGDVVKQWMMDSIEQQSSVHPLNIDYDELFRKIKRQISVEGKKKQAASFIRSIVRWAAAIIIAFLIGGLASYFIFNTEPVHKKNFFCEIASPYGSKTELTLPDGSKVWLNAGSKLKYANNFNQDNRDVLLDGEAFFEIEKNKNLPFIVNTSGIDVKVVGTTFNVKAYWQENTITTTLVKGKVLLQSKKYHLEKDAELFPSQKAIFSKSDKQLVIANIDDVYSEISWKDNLLIIKGEMLSELAVKLERKYNMRIIFGSDDIKTYKFSGKLKDETIQQVLDVIKLSAPIDYRINGKNIVLTKNTATIDSYNKFLKKRTKK